jgi:hypothetical protein
MHSLELRFWSKVEKTETCWLWLGHKALSGYGQFSVNRAVGNMQAHRMAYLFEKGSIPTGLVIDHLCRNKACVNPDHLEPVTQFENVLRGNSMRLKDFCLREHKLAEAYVSRRGKRQCRECKNLNERKRYAERRQARA